MDLHLTIFLKLSRAFENVWFERSSDKWSTNRLNFVI